MMAMSIVMTTQAQFSVRLIVNTVATKANEDIYVAGNFNNWNPKDEQYKLKPFGGNRRSVVLKNMAAGTYAFKFSRGGTDKLETTADGRDIADRVLEVNDDLSLEFNIPGWKDDYPDKPKRYSASPQVRIMDTAFSIPQLGKKRRVWVYLPKGYANSGKTYPVLYMQDGQELFNDQTAAAGEWGIDECLDSLQQQTGKYCIVVAVDHGGAQRNKEYNPWDASPELKGEGKEFAAFLANTLKPYIDTKYRTLKSAGNQFLLGSDWGGVISLYTALQYPNVFGGAAAFSPDFTSSAGIFDQAEQFNTTAMPAFYLYAGVKEAGGRVAQVEKMSAILKKKQRFVLRTVINPLGQLSITYWQQEFRDFYKWWSAQWP